MKTLIIALSASIFSVATAGAANDISTVDRNGDRFATYYEIASVYPNVTAYDFRAIDTNSDDRLSSLELLSEEARSVFNRKSAEVNGATNSDVVDTDGDNIVSLFRTGGRLSWPVRK